jgi:Ca-activated chloride channel family protein
MRTLSLAIVIGACSLALVQGAQQKPIRSVSNTVEIYATVTDRQGRLIPDLKVTDFEIRDEGKTQPITVFEAGIQPITSVVMLDESPSVFESSERIANGVAAFNKQLLTGDRATLGYFSHIVRLEPALSRNLTRLLNDFPPGRQRFPAGTAVWDALDAAAAVLASESGRRVVLILTDAEDNCSQSNPEEVRDRFGREGTMVYAIGVRGDGGLPVRELRDLTRDSGGYYFELKPEDDLAATFARVADELHRQYVIGFAAPQLDGKSHEITVRVNRQGASIRARRSYVAPKGGGGGQ